MSKFGVYSFYVCAFCLFFVLAPLSAQEPPADMTQSADNIKTLIDAKQYDQAAAQVQAFCTKYAGRAELPDALGSLACKYKDTRNYDYAGNLYQYIADTYPDVREKWLLRVSICEFEKIIAKKDFAGARQAAEASAGLLDESLGKKRTTYH